MKVISYSFFEPKELSEHRDWDPWRLDRQRYWFNIPIVVIANSLFYPNYQMKVFLSENVTSHPLFSLFTRMGLLFHNFSYETVALPYETIEPTLWRMKPLWDPSTELLFCRDIDSIPTIKEVAASLYFERSPFAVHSIRSHTRHRIPRTIMLAGLCGFKPDKIPFWKSDTFENYYAKGSKGGWGADQDALINYFIFRDVIWSSGHFLDSPLSSEEHEVPRLRELNLDILGVNVHDALYNERSAFEDPVFDELDGITKWAGEPVDARPALKRLFEKHGSHDAVQKMKAVLGQPELRDFYLVQG